MKTAEYNYYFSTLSDTMLVTTTKVQLSTLSQQVLEPSPQQSMVLGVVPSAWTTWLAQGERQDWPSAPMILTPVTAVIRKTLLFDANIRVSVLKASEADWSN